VHLSFGFCRVLLAPLAPVFTRIIENSGLSFDYHIRVPRDHVGESHVALVTGGAVLGFDDQVHIDLDYAHSALSPDEARQFAAELKRIANAIDPLSGLKSGE
jgi:hypothetical protein